MTTMSVSQLQKCPTGITGFDDITGGGLPRGRPTLLAGHAGTGKTLFALEFILHGIERHGEPGVFVSFEETPAEIAINVASIGFDLALHQLENRLRVLHIDLGPDELVESGEYDLDGLFLRLGAAIDATGAQRIALDGVENLFAAFDDLRILRAEFRRLMCWFKDRNITAVVTTERGVATITRHGLEEYIADCVVTLDQRVDDQIATRRLRIVKYRGSAHGSDECPFVLDRNGFIVMPLSSAGLDYPVSSEKLSTGIGSLDSMLVGGIFRGSSVLVSGRSGTGKSSIAAHLVNAACARGERSLYVALEESPAQILRNMSSIGFDLKQWVDAGLLRFHAARPTARGLESHLVALSGMVEEFTPQIVVIDPITSLNSGQDSERVKAMLIRAVDLFKSRGITSLFTALTAGDEAPESTSVAVSSLVDVWLLLRNLESTGERTRALYVCKARGTAHSNQVREFLLTTEGVRLVDVMLGASGEILTGSGRLMREQQQTAERVASQADADQRRAILERRRRELDAKISALRAEYEEEIDALNAEIEQGHELSSRKSSTLSALARVRGNTGSAE
ncbi:MAG: circadian clock protein KaiC [Azoarcus sp.]|nr:circadian clock protein KaiC [Azoarcus sp.]